LSGLAVFEPLIKLAVSKADWLIDEYLERQRIILMIAMPGTLLFLLLFWAFSGAGGLMLILALFLAVLEAVLAGGIFLLHEKYKDEIAEWHAAAEAIDAFLCGSDVFSEWSQFLEAPQEDRRLEQLRINCTRLPEEYPPEPGDEYCSQEGHELLQTYVTQLRIGVATKASEDFGKWWVVWRAGRDERKARRAEKRSEKEARTEEKAQAKAAAAERAPKAAPMKPMPSLAKGKRAAKRAPKPKKARPSKKEAKRSIKAARKAAKRAARRSPRYDSCDELTVGGGSQSTTSHDAGVGMVTEAAAIQQIMDAGFTAHDFDRKQEQILKHHGRVPSPGEVVRGLVAEQQGKGRKPKRSRRATKARAPRSAKVKVHEGGPKIRWFRFVVFIGAICGAPFAAWRIPKYQSDPVIIAGEVHHQVLDQPKDIRHQLRTPFEEMLYGNRAVNLVDGRRIYVSEADFKLCWPESWEAIYEGNYTMRISAKARPLYFNDYTVAEITQHLRVDHPVASAR
jgi:hypothetical protein